jgi:serine/threonine protein kinase
LTSRGQAKLVDLGLVKDLGSLSGLTRSRIGLGTMQFAAPEQFEDARSADPRSDIYALAGTLYQALTGEAPFGVGTSFSILERKLNNQFEPPIQKNPTIHSWVDAAIRAALQADRSRRPATCSEFIALLTGARSVSDGVVLPGDAPKPKPAPRQERRASIRYAADLQTKCRPLMGARNQDCWTALIKDLSVSGVSMHVKRRFEVGNMLDVVFSSSDENTISHIARVRRIQPADSRGWLLGCEFVSPLSQEELDGLFNERLNRTVMMQPSSGTFTPPPPLAGR